MSLKDDERSLLLWDDIFNLIMFRSKNIIKLMINFVDEGTDWTSYIEPIRSEWAYSVWGCVEILLWN